MALYDRQYMRFGTRANRSDPLIWLIGLMIGGYFLQVFSRLLFKSDAVTHFFAMSRFGLAELHFWTPLSYIFVHAPENPLHLLINLLIIFMLGRPVLQELGRTRFLWIAGLAALGGSLLFMTFHIGAAHFQLLGASAVAMGLLTAFCMLRPDEPITFLILFVLPVRVRPKVLLIGASFVEVIMLTAELQGLSDVASSAHLGGMLAAFLYYRRAVLGKSLFPAAKGITLSSRGRVKGGAQAPRFSLNIKSRNELRAEVDRILDKINTQGFGSLSDEEKRTLDRARDILGR